MFGLKVPVCQSIGSPDFDSVNTILSNSTFNNQENTWSPKVDGKGNVFYMEIEERCKFLKHKSILENSIDDVGYGTDNEVSNISNIMSSAVISSPNAGQLSDETCPDLNCTCAKSDRDPDFYRMDNLIQLKIPVKSISVSKINGDTPKPKSYIGRLLCKELLGIIPGHFKSSKSSSNQRLCIRGLDPTRNALKKKKIQIGDCLRLINGQEVTWNNIDDVFTRLCSSAEATIVIQQVSKGSQKSHHKPPSKQIITKDSGIVQLFPKQEKTTHHQPFSDNSHAVLYVDLDKLNSEENNKDEDVLFQFPEKSQGLVRMRGAFVTLFSTLKEISSSSTNRCTFVYDNKKMNVAYHKEDNNLLMIIFPQDRVHPILLPTILQNLVRVLQVQYNSIHEAFSHQNNHPTITALLSSVMYQLESSSLNVIDSDHCSSCQHSVQYLSLDSVFSDSIDRIITGLEASDSKEMTDSYYGCRRTYTMLGSCLFYKTSVVCNHLPQEDLLDVYLYLKYHFILSVCSRETVQTTVIWREIFPTRQFYYIPEEEPFGYTEPVAARWFWLIVAYKHTVLCTMLETSGYHNSGDVSLSPDPFLIDQAKATLMQIINLNMYQQMDHCTRQNTSSMVTSLSDGVHGTANGSVDVVKNNLFNKHRKSTRFHRDSSVRSSASSDSGSSVESYKKPLVYYHSAEGTYLYDVNHGLDLPRIDIKLSVGRDNCMLHYLHVDKHEGVYIKSDEHFTDSRILHNFSLSCTKIKHIFDRYRYKRKSGNQGSEEGHMLPIQQDPTFRNIREEGVLFQMPNPNSEEKTTVSYWVVGRQRSLTETYVCFRDGIPQSTVELAFKIAFGIKPG